MGVFESLLNNTFTLSRRRRTADGQGGWTISYQVLGTALGQISPAAGAERDVADLEERQISHVLFLVDGEDIARGDRVTCLGLEVEVLGIREPSLADHHLEIDCLERVFEVSIEIAGLYWPERAYPERAYPERAWVGP